MPGVHQTTASTLPAEVAGITGAHLLQYIERIERLEEEKAELGEQVRELFQEAKSGGFDPKILRIVLRERKRTPEELDEEETMVLLYKQALGMTTGATA
ncbi:MAG: DUF2312 domain-containing protein [Magnetococcales bacterium]|nr:DUF2312 domain-containing protein [Magnetococcales bacterium]